MAIICTLIFVYVLLIFARILLSWFPIGYDSPLKPVNSFLFAATEPVLGPLRNAIPPVRLGGAALDLSPLVVLIGAQVLRAILCG